MKTVTECKAERSKGGIELDDTNSNAFLLVPAETNVIPFPITMYMHSSQTVVL